MGGKSSKEKKEKAAAQDKAKLPAVGKKHVDPTASPKPSLPHARRNERDRALLAAADLLPPRASNQTAAAHVAAMSFFLLAARANEAAIVPDDIAAATLAPLTLAGETGWLWADAPEGFGDDAVFAHRSKTIILSLPKSANGWFNAHSRSRGFVSVYSSPTGNGFKDGRSEEPVIFTKLEKQWHLFRELRHDEQLPESMHTIVEWAAPDADPAALPPAFRGDRGPMLCVLREKAEISNTQPLQLFADGAQRVVPGKEEHCFHAFVCDEAPVE